MLYADHAQYAMQEACDITTHDVSSVQRRGSFEGMLHLTARCRPHDNAYFCHAFWGAAYKKTFLALRNSASVSRQCICCAASPLEGYQPHEWVAFERALVVRDIFTGGVRTFLSTEDAQAFRSLIYKQYSEPSCCLPTVSCCL